jgi:hypothetical protein
LLFAVGLRFALEGKSAEIEKRTKTEGSFNLLRRLKSAEERRDSKTDFVFAFVRFFTFYTHSVLK